MKRILTLALTVIAAGSMLAADVVDAKRLGAGRSFGAQRQAVQPPAKAPAAAPTQAAPAATPAAPPGAAANPVMPPGAAAAKAAPAAAGAAAAGTAARSGMSRWLGPVAGLAAGLGLAALAAHLGIAEELMSLMLIMLLVVVGIVVVRMIMARRAPARSPLPYAGAGPGLGRQPGGYETQVPPVFRNSMPSPARVEPSFPRSGAVARAIPGVPADFDTAGFLAQARLQFNRLQSAYDRNDRPALAQVMTPEMFADVAQELDRRDAHVPTEVVDLEAELLDVATEQGKHWASVRFRGLTREDGAATPQPFDEIWNLEKPVNGSSGWLLAGIRQLDSLNA